MCAVVANSRIHTLIALPASSERSCGVAEPTAFPNFPSALVVVAGIGLLFWLNRRARQEPTIDAGQLILGAYEHGTRQWPDLNPQVGAQHHRVRQTTAEQPSFPLSGKVREVSPRDAQITSAHQSQSLPSGCQGAIESNCGPEVLGSEPKR
jgi:hypothetical protein